MDRFSGMVDELLIILGMQLRNGGTEVQATARRMYVSLGGPCQLQTLLHSPLLSQSKSNHSTELPSKDTVDMINKVLNILTELSLAEDHAAASLTMLPQLLPRLFELMGMDDTLDGAVSLAQELLATGAELFSLSTVQDLALLVQGLQPRALSLFCRTMATLFSKPEPGPALSLPPPECVPPHLCAACANRALLVEMPHFLPRMLTLLKSSDPPRRLWPTRHLIVGNPSAHMHEPTPNDTWETLTTPGREWVPQETMIVLPSDQVPPGLSAAPLPNIHGPHDYQLVKLEAFERELWATLQADLLFVLATLLGNKAREKTQALLIEHDFVGMLDALFQRLTWHPPAAQDGSSSHGPGCTCCPQSCLQISMLRTLAAFCEKSQPGSGHHHLLLSESQRRRCTRGNSDPTHNLSDDADAGQSLSSPHRMAMDDPNLHQPEYALDQSTNQNQADGSTDSDRSLLSAIIRELVGQRRESPFVFDLSSTVHKWLQGASPEEQELVLEEPGFVRWILVELLAGSAKTAEQSRQPQPVQPTNQTDDAAAQDAEHLQLGCDTQQVLLDLLGELVKFNARALSVVSATLASVLGVIDRETFSEVDEACMSGSIKDRMTDILDRLLLGHMVNASVFVHCVELTLGDIPKPKRRRLAPHSSAVTDAFEELIVSAQEVSYENRTAKDLKLLLERRSLDASGCLEKGDLVSALKRADVALVLRVLDPASTTDEKGAEAVPRQFCWRTDGVAASKQRTCECGHPCECECPSGYLACIWSWLRPQIALKLLMALAEKSDNRFSSDLCVINAAIVLFSEAKAAGRLEKLLDHVQRLHAQQSKSSQDKGQAGRLSSSVSGSMDVIIAEENRGASLKGSFSMAELVDSFIQALEWWTKYYDKQNYEKRFMEFQSGISLETWQSMVKELMSVAKSLLPEVQPTTAS
mmetsp:Transcript_35490/g.47914  ORF Transcript_35490/g.47914 Transcript_35490/m.47914 type:complete len:926 (-) Transcript_35490:162-2939(-)